MRNKFTNSLHNYPTNATMHTTMSLKLRINVNSNSNAKDHEKKMELDLNFRFFSDYEKRYPDMKSRFIKIFSINSNMQKLINIERTYVDALCPNIHIMELIFDIGKLEDCEKSIRYGLSSFPEKYITYKQHVSGFFKAIIVNNWQQLTRFIRIFPIQVVSTSTVTVPTTIATPIKKHENAATVSNEQIEFGINNTKNRLKNSGYNEVHDHPMIAHFPKLAHAYTSCCKMNETPDMLKTYLDNVDTYSHRSYTLLTLILNWLVSLRK